jgi:hypothetical protein
MIGTENNPAKPDSIIIGGSLQDRNTIKGQISESNGGRAISLSFRDGLEPAGYQGSIPIYARYNDFGVYTAGEIRSRIFERGDTTLALDTVLTDPFYSPKVAVSVKIFLQGPYNTGTNLMTNGLRTGGYLDSRFGVGKAPALAVDSINLELRNARTGTGSSTRKYAPAWLLTDGTILDFSDTSRSYVEFDTTAGFYFIVVRHRNHLAIMTKDSLSLSPTAALYDFSTFLTQAYGTNPMVAAGTRFAMWAGDVNGNGQVKYNLGGNDRSLILTRVGGTNINATVSGYYDEDVSMNGQVKYNLGGNDRSIILTNIGGTSINATRNSQVP